MNELSQLTYEQQSFIEIMVSTTHLRFCSPLSRAAWSRVQPQPVSSTFSCGCAVSCFTHCSCTVPAAAALSQLQPLLLHTSSHARNELTRR